MSQLVNQSKTVAYRRISTEKQDSERQLFKTGINFDAEYEDKLSGSSSNRPAFQECLASLNKGDTLYIHDISRGGRNTEDVLAFIRKLNEGGVNVKFYKEGLEFSGDEKDPMKRAISQMVLTMLAACATLFLTNNTAAINDGLVRAKALGHKSGAANEKYNRKKVNIVNDNTRKDAREHVAKFKPQIQLMVGDKWTLKKMAEGLNKLGARTATGKEYNPSTVKNICKYLEIER